MNRYLFTLILLTQVLVPATVLADPARIQVPNLTTERLAPICKQLLSGKQQAMSVDQGLCIGIILGVEDNASYDKKICVPKQIDITERVLVVDRYIATQRNRTNEAYASLAFDALIQKWPCAK
jgi:hypothetical protein